MNLVWIVTAINLKDKDDEYLEDTSDSYYLIADEASNILHTSREMPDQSIYVQWDRADFALNDTTTSLELEIFIRDKDLGQTDQGLGRVQINLPDHPNLTEDISLDFDFSSKRTTCFELANGARFAVTNAKGTAIHKVSKSEIKASCGIDEEDSLCKTLCDADFTEFFCNTFCSSSSVSSKLSFLAS